MGTEGTADGMRRWPPELQCATGALGPDRHLQHGAAGGRQQLLAGPLEAEGLRRPAVVQVIRPTHLWARRHVGEGAPKTVSHPDRGGGSCAGKAGGGVRITAVPPSQATIGPSGPPGSCVPAVWGPSTCPPDKRERSASLGRPSTLNTWFRWLKRPNCGGFFFHRFWLPESLQPVMNEPLLSRSHPSHPKLKKNCSLENLIINICWKTSKLIQLYPL